MNVTRIGRRKRRKRKGSDVKRRPR